MKVGNPPRSVSAVMLRLAVLPVAFLAGDRLLALAASTVVAGSRAPLAKAYTGELKSGVWIAGNSRALRSFDASAIAESTDSRVANLGVNGVSPELVHAMLRDWLDKNNPPKTLILEVSYLKNDWNDSLGADFLLFADSGTCLDRLLAERSPEQSYAARLLRLRRYGGEQFFRSFAAGSDGDQNRASARAISEHQIESVKQRPREKFEIRESVREDLAGLLKRCKESSVRVVLVLAPYLAEYWNRLEDMDSFLTQVEEAAGAAEPSVSFIDGSTAFTEAEFFTDHVHLNRRGRERFTRWFADRLP